MARSGQGAFGEVDAAASTRSPTGRTPSSRRSRRRRSCRRFAPRRQEQSAAARGGGGGRPGARRDRGDEEALARPRRPPPRGAAQRRRRRLHRASLAAARAAPPPPPRARLRARGGRRSRRPTSAPPLRDAASRRLAYRCAVGVTHGDIKPSNAAHLARPPEDRRLWRPRPIATRVAARDDGAAAAELKIGTPSPRVVAPELISRRRADRAAVGRAEKTSTLADRRGSRPSADGRSWSLRSHRARAARPRRRRRRRPRDRSLRARRTRRCGQRITAPRAHASVVDAGSGGGAPESPLHGGAAATRGRGGGGDGELRCASTPASANASSAMRRHDRVGATAPRDAGAARVEARMTLRRGRPREAAATARIVRRGARDPRRRRRDGAARDRAPRRRDGRVRRARRPRRR